jgi:uncharacterized membrane-anchored protein
MKISKLILEIVVLMIIITNIIINQPINVLTSGTHAFLMDYT